jgi:hypothetical protein
VTISIPTRGSIRAETMEWTLRAFVELAPDVQVDIVSENVPLEHARNLQAQRFLASPSTHLFLLDADCVPQAGTIQKLLAYELPVVAAPHPTLKGAERVVMALTRNNGHYEAYTPPLGLQKVDAVGGSGLLIERRVLESYGPPYFRCEYDDQGMLYRSEDFWFCERVKEQGFDVWCDFSLEQQHIKEVAV